MSLQKWSKPQKSEHLPTAQRAKRLAQIVSFFLDPLCEYLNTEYLNLILEAEIRAKDQLFLNLNLAPRKP